MTVFYGDLKYLNQKKEYRKLCKRHNQYVTNLEKTIELNKNLKNDIKKLSKKADDTFITTIEKRYLKRCHNLVGYNESLMRHYQGKIERTKL